MTTRLTRVLSVTLALISIAALVYIDIEIVTRYNQADGKTNALFGLIELSEFNYRYSILIPAVFSMLFTIRLLRINNWKTWDLITLFIGLISIVGTVTPSWRLLI
jgi:hypothetical protein